GQTCDLDGKPSDERKSRRGPQTELAVRDWNAAKQQSKADHHHGEIDETTDDGLVPGGRFCGVAYTSAGGDDPEDEPRGPERRGNIHAFGLPAGRESPRRSEGLDTDRIDEDYFFAVSAFAASAL